MYAWNSLGPEHQDLITVRASHSEWSEVIDFLFDAAPDLLTEDSQAWILIKVLRKVGVVS